MNVSAVIVTRGDVELQPVIDSLPPEWEVLVWDNGARMVNRSDGWAEVCTDLTVYGRYAAIEYASHDLIYVQDDDCVVKDPDAIVRSYYENMVVCNMPQEFRHDFYTDHALVGFGAAFHRDAPRRAFELFANGAWDVAAPVIDDEEIHYVWEYGEVVNSHPDDRGLFHRTCDIVFTGLSTRFLVDVPKKNLPWAYGDDRMWKQPDHQQDRDLMLQMVRSIGA